MAYSTDALALTPRHYWRMGAASGAETDLGSGGANLTVSGATRDVTSPALGADDDGQCTFDGVNDYASADLSLQAATSITLAGWITVGSYANDDRMGLEYSPNPNSNAGFSLDIGNSTGGEANSISVSITGAGGSNRYRRTFSRDLLPAGEQHHLALVLGTAGSITVYVDGEPAATNLADGGTPGGTFPDTTLYLASRAATNLWCPVSWDELLVFTRALSSDDVAALALVPGVGPATLYVDADHSGASDAGNREAAQNPATPLVTIQRAVTLAVSGDTIEIVKAATTYAAFDAASEDTGATNITIRGSAGGTNRPSITRWTMVDRDGWTVEDVITDGTAGEPARMYRSTNLTFRRWHAKQGGAEFLHWTGLMLFEDCDVEAPYSPGAAGAYMNGVGFRVGSQYTLDAFNANDLTFRNCRFSNIGGEDAIELAGLAADSHTGTILVENCSFQDIAQGGSGAHTDGIQSGGCDTLIVRACRFENVDSMIIASDGFINNLTIENCLFIGDETSGFSVQLSGVRSATIRHNTWANSRFGGLRWFLNNNNVDSPARLVYNNIIDSYFVNDGWEPAIGEQFNNVIITGPRTASDIEGFPEFGTSADTDWELANSPITSPGIDDGATVSGSPSTDRLGRPREGQPDCGCHESAAATAVTPQARPPYVLALFPADGATGVARGTTVTASLLPVPGSSIDEATVTSSTFRVTDPDGYQVPATVTLGGIDGSGRQMLTLEIEGILYPRVLFTTRLDGVQDDQGSTAAVRTSAWRTIGPEGPAVGAVNAGWTVGALA
jgi:hypothetical protein